MTCATVQILIPCRAASRSTAITVEVVRHRLATFVLRELGCAAVTPLKDDWLDFNLDGPYRFGWMPPVGLLSANMISRAVD